MSASIERITRMEYSLNECRQAIDQLAAQLEKMDEVREPMTELFRYYGSEDWYEDREAEIPDGIPAGVLSEDLIYDAVTDVRDLAFHMLEQATDILKNRI